MTHTAPHETVHDITIHAPAQVVFGLIADVASWPRMFPPSVYVEHVEHGAREERIRIWATANDEVKSWTSHRTLDPDGLRIRFRQDVSQPPVAAMGGEWAVQSRSDRECRVVLTHDFWAIDGDPENVAWINRAVDRNSTQELAALKAAAEREADADDLTLTFDDVVRVDGAPADVYDFIYDAGRWEERLPHVARVELTENIPNQQVLEMDTLTADGSRHTTRSVRVCLPPDRIVYKQLQTPALMSVHTGQWTIGTDSDGTVVTSTHTVVLNPDAIAGVLGPDATIADARTFVRDALGRNSTTTMRHAKEYAEQRRTASVG